MEERVVTVRVPKWQPFTAYALGDVVANYGRLYLNLEERAISAARGGPRGIGKRIVDNLAVWRSIGTLAKGRKGGGK